MPTSPFDIFLSPQRPLTSHASMPPSGYPTQPARLCLLDSLPAAHATTSPRVRVVGRVVGLLPSQSLALLADGSSAVLVDLSLAVLHGEAPPPRLKDRLMVTGEMVALSDPLPVPDLAIPLASSSTPPSIDPFIVLKAERIQECEELDMEGWRKAVEVVQARLAGA
ncbi:RHTO0S03e00826g1_1 [Rhodotorula toruloides]|uniref:RHTO0S03e00826g1_1 n=2 Tax=Rhodotorula toruloides TaxID=5286 RepID=A0A061AL93_RHOTO|nr:uncharacterized protein RHTO_00072 [Rhodotorula toruloides NP11]EMS25644.1 hypothetical protein RHTO_00072 [Rhodotorula toruloides NP11]CDR37908.1 RHTO0S03e00826g1_1 [Rhodotorula toruloides]